MSASLRAVLAAGVRSAPPRHDPPRIAPVGARRGALPRALPRRSPEPHPLSGCSGRALLVICGLTLSVEELAAVVEPGAPAHGESGAGEVMRRVAERVRVDPEVAHRLQRAIDVRVGHAAQDLDGWPLGAIAELWWAVRTSLDAPRAAAILWRVVRDARPLARTLEERIAEDIELFALRRFSAPSGARREPGG